MIVIYGNSSRTVISIVVLSTTILWAAGVQASSLCKKLGVDLDSQNRVIVEADLSLKNYSNIFVAGDQAHFSHQDGKTLPGLAPVAIQQGRSIAKNILRGRLDRS